MNIGIDIRCLMDKERSGVGEYAFRLLDSWFREAATLRGLISIEPEARVAPAAALRAQKLLGCNLGKCEFFLFYNSFRDVSANLPQWNYPFVHYHGFHWPNKILNFCLRFLNFPKFDKFVKRRGPTYEISEVGPPSIDLFIFPNQNFYALSEGVKKIVIVHDLAQEIYPECFSLKQRFWHRFVNLRRMVKDAYKIIAVSENTKFDLINLYGIDPTRIIVLCPKIPLLRYTGVSEQRERGRLWRSDAATDALTYSRELENGGKYNISNDEKINLHVSRWSSGLPADLGAPDRGKEQVEEKYILFLGTIEPRKNVLGLLKAYELLNTETEPRRTLQALLGGAERRRLGLEYPEVRPLDIPELWIAGKAGYRSQEVFNYWKKMRARDKVKFLGYVSEDQKWELYRGARVFVYPSLYEGFGMPVLEALAAGTSVITSLTSSMHEIAANRGILIDPNRVEDLAQAIDILA